MMFQLLKWRWIAGASESASGRKTSRRVWIVGAFIKVQHVMCWPSRLPETGPSRLIFVRCYFWHFGHQNVERPFWVKRRTMPPQPAVWHFSPSRS